MSNRRSDQVKTAGNMMHQHSDKQQSTMSATNKKAVQKISAISLL